MPPSAAAGSQPRPVSRVWRQISHTASGYLQLTKPSIMLLVLVTGATALILEGSFLSQPGKLGLFLVGLYLTGGSANAFNQYFERELDGRMVRTRRRRPLPTGQISAPGALVFAVGIGVGGVVLLAVLFNLLTAGLSLATLLFYSLFYTLWLKPHTPLNIVIGGAAGAMAPVGAWAAATGGTGLVPWILFLVVFLWTPPHFWSLALHFQDDYRLSGYPMLPVVKGEKAAVQQIERYTYALTAVSLAYLLAGGGVLYGIGAAVLGIGFIVKVAALKRGADRRSPWALFSYSILYLFGLFAAMIIDKFTERVW